MPPQYVLDVTRLLAQNPKPKTQNPKPKTQNPKPKSREGEAGNGGNNERVPIESSDEASSVVNNTREQIALDANTAQAAQGNLDRDRVLELIG